MLFCKRIFSGTHILIFDWRPQYVQYVTTSVVSLLTMRQLGLLKFQKKNRKRITIAFSSITSIHLQNEAKQNECAKLLDVQLLKIGRVFSTRWVASSFRSVSAVWENNITLLTSRQIFRYAVPARTVTKKHCVKFSIAAVVSCGCQADPDRSGLGSYFCLSLSLPTRRRLVSISDSLMSLAHRRRQRSYFSTSNYKQRC